MATLRIATFNVLFGPQIGAGSWSERRPLVRRSMEVARPDILGLQEVLPSKLADAAELVAPLTLVPGPSTGAPRWSPGAVAGGSSLSERMRAGEHLPIAYRADRFERLGSGGFWISASPDEPGSLLPFALSPFLVHWARLAPRNESGSLLILNAHFGHAPWHHTAAARVVAERIRSLAYGDTNPAVSSVFLVGDFNAVPSSKLVRSLTSRSGAGLADAARSAVDRRGPPATYHWGRGITRFGLNLDYVLARTSMRPARAEVVDVHDGRLYPSDHHLLMVEFAPPVS